MIYSLPLHYIRKHEVLECVLTPPLEWQMFGWLYSGYWVIGGALGVVTSGAPWRVS